MNVERTATLVAYALCAVGLLPTMLLATRISKAASLWHGILIVAVGLAIVTPAFDAGPSHEI
jgi:fucose permease